MKLVSCYITGFGKYVKQRIDFNDDITSVCEENGSGKSTLATYIKAMFYGLKSTGLKFAERKHYAPFDGGQFGGSIVFEYGGKTYKIERHFGESARGAKDWMEVTCGGVVTKEFGDCPGEKIFGIDMDSFERTVFVTSNDIQLSSTESIKSKLNGFIEGGGGGAKLDDAVHALDDKKKEYAGSRKSGLVDREKAKQNTIEKELSNIRGISAALPKNYKDLEDIENELSEVDEKINAVHAQNSLKTKWDTYDGYVNDAKQDEVAANDIKRKYADGVPESERAKDFSRDFNRLKSLQAAMETSSFTSEDERALGAYERQFKNGVPSDEYLNALQKDISNESSIASDIKSAENGMPTKTDVRWTKFETNPPKGDILNELDDLTRDYSLLKDAIDAAAVPSETYMPGNEQKNSSRNVGAIVLLVLAAIFVIAGIICIFPDISIGIPIALIVVGVVLLVLAGFLYLLRRISSGGGVIYESAETRENRRKLEECQTKIGALIMPYGYGTSGDIVYDAKDFKTDYSAYKSTAAETARLKAYIDEKVAEREGCVSRIEGAFSQFSLSDGDYFSRLVSLRNDVAAYDGLLRRKSGFEKNSADTAKEMKETAERVERFKRAFQISDDADPSAIYTDALNYETLTRNSEEKSKKARDYMASNNLLERPKEGTESADDLEKRRKELGGRRASKITEISEYESQTEKEQTLLNEKAESEDLQKEYERRVDILQTAVKWLQNADKTLKEKYIDPVGKSFEKYTSSLNALIGERVFIDDDLNVKFEHGAGVKEEGHMSSGQKSICTLCFRLAMIDNMYGGEKPFLVMDDPFVALDSRHLELAKQLIKDISKDHQIIYFTCHDSRRI